MLTEEQHIKLGNIRKKKAYEQIRSQAVLH